MPAPFVPGGDWYRYPIKTLIGVLKLIKDICFILLRGSIFAGVEEDYESSTRNSSRSRNADISMLSMYR